MRKSLFILGIIAILVWSMVFSTYANSADFRYIGFKVYDPVYIAKDLGFYEEEGLDLELIETVSAGPNAVQAVAGGSAEGGLSSWFGIINARSAGLPIIGVNDIQSSLEGQPLEVYYVNKDSDIKEIADLKGKRATVNLVRSSFHYTLLMALEQNGLKENDLKNVSILSFDNQTLALLNEDTDLIGLMEPYVSHTNYNHGKDVRVLFDALDIFGEKQFTAIFINSVWAKSNPDKATAFSTATAKASEWAMENPKQAKEIVAKYTGIDAKYMSDYLFQPGGIVVKEDAQEWIDYLKNRGDLANDWVTVDMVATNEYNELFKND